MTRRNPLWGHDPSDREHPQEQPVPLFEWRKLAAKAMVVVAAGLWARPRLADGHREGATLLVAIGAAVAGLGLIEIATLATQRPAERIFFKSTPQAGWAMVLAATIGGLLVGVGLARGA